MGGRPIEGEGNDGRVEEGVAPKQRSARNLRRALSYATQKANNKAEEVASLISLNKQLEKDNEEEHKARDDAVNQVKDQVKSLETDATTLGKRLSDRTTRFTNSISQLKTSHKAKRAAFNATLLESTKGKEADIEEQKKRRRNGVMDERQKGEDRLNRSRNASSSHFNRIKVRLYLRSSL